MKLKNLNCDETQNLNCDEIQKTQFVMKLQTLIVMKLKNLNCKESQKLKL